MKNEICVICSVNRGKRVCKINNSSLICPICCAKTRNADCEGCVFYAQAQKHSSSNKSTVTKPKDFIMVIDPEINDKVNDALELAEQGKLKIAEGTISALFKKHPQIDFVQYGMGVICLMKNEYDQALLYFEKAVEINPYFVEAWFNIGAVHHKRLEAGEMIKAYQKVIEFGDITDHYVKHAKHFLENFENKIRNKSGLSLDQYMESMDIFNDAYTAMENKEWEKAISGFNKVLAFDPQHPQSYGNLGICYGHLGKKQEALAALDKALQIDPHYEPAILNRRYISSLAEGEKISVDNFTSVEYYKDFKIKKKSLINKIFG